MAATGATRRDPERAPAARRRDPRLDFFRGLALLVIVVTHTPANPWAAWAPGRFGFSDAAEVFVFCSGIASALAFGATYARAGWLLGTARVGLRLWQVYWAHIGSFVVITAAMVALTGTDLLLRDYVAQLNLTPFLRDPGPNLVGLLTLTYVPNYFDILPMYLAILAMIPAAMALGARAPALLLAASVALWLAAWAGGLNLPAEPWSDRQWFFNPFAWQLLFFIGFGLGMGWLRPPPVTPTLIALALLVVILALPLANPPLRMAIPALADAREAIQPLVIKSGQGPLRLLYFLSLAYLAWVLVGPGGERLAATPGRARATTAIRAVGRQSLAVFVVGLLVSRLMGVGLDVLGRGAAAAVLVNVAGIAACFATAHAAAWIKSAPWRAPPRAAPAAVPGQVPAEAWDTSPAEDPAADRSPAPAGGKMAGRAGA
jgi:hypothetical protein